jgi:hypothetical protein
VAAEVARFFEVVAILDREFVATPASTWSLERIFQGPLADALTHVGQINMLRRLAGYPVRGENYAKAEIEVGRVGLDQARPVRDSTEPRPEPGGGTRADRDTDRGT